MTTVYTAVTAFVTAITGWMTSLLSFIISNPLLMTFCVGVPLVSFAVGLIRRLLGTRA